MQSPRDSYSCCVDSFLLFEFPGPFKVTKTRDSRFYLFQYFTCLSLKIEINFFASVSCLLLDSLVESITNKTTRHDLNNYCFFLKN